MLVLGPFVEDKLWSGIIVRITILRDRWGLYATRPLRAWGDRIFPTRPEKVVLHRRRAGGGLPLCQVEIEGRLIHGGVGGGDLE